MFTWLKYGGNFEVVAGGEEKVIGLGAHLHCGTASATPRQTLISGPRDGKVKASAKAGGLAVMAKLRNA